MKENKKKWNSTDNFNMMKMTKKRKSWMKLLRKWYKRKKRKPRKRWMQQRSHQQIIHCQRINEQNKSIIVLNIFRRKLLTQRISFPNIITITLNQNLING